MSVRAPITQCLKAHTEVIRPFLLVLVLWEDWQISLTFQLPPPPTIILHMLLDEIYTVGIHDPVTNARYAKILYFMNSATEIVAC